MNINNLEIEKKYLIKQPIQLDLSKYKKLSIFQAYLTPNKVFLNNEANTLEFYFGGTNCNNISLNIENNKISTLSEINDYSIEDLTIRIRQTRSNDQSLYFLTIKTNSKNSGLIRNEYEIIIDESSFKNLKNECGKSYIRKSRYIIPIENGLNVELDVFEDHLQGLVLAEVEFSTIEQANHFVPPDFVGDIDVTHVLDFSNKFLVNLRRDELWKAIAKISKE